MKAVWGKFCDFAHDPDNIRSYDVDPGYIFISVGKHDSNNRGSIVENAGPLPTLTLFRFNSSDLLKQIDRNSSRNVRV